MVAGGQKKENGNQKKVQKFNSFLLLLLKLVNSTPKKTIYYDR